MSSVSDGRRSRLVALQRLAIDVGRKDFEARYPDLSLSPVVALVCAYEEEANLGAVLAKIPAEACGLEVTPLVVVDGGEDATDRVAQEAGAVTFVFPTNLGHGVALRVGYDLCVTGGARYVVTLDADGQNDPAEMETMLQPLVDDEADFVVASRRLGVDETADSYRKLGVRWFSWLMNLLMGSRLTDTSNGYRALRVTMLADIASRLEQDQYQTAELLITAMSRGWRVTERPTVWHERLSGTSKKGANWIYGFRYAAVILRTWRREQKSLASLGRSRH
ncbi:MAG: glycosyltransferase family 2 protein [Actinomycetota bacterium]|jgi:glycosyltransferase involved in cell wall biosynthesis|nr:glycosyltransferase family 2 protein [Actinomycetota bacterium]